MISMKRFVLSVLVAVSAGCYGTAAVEDVSGRWALKQDRDFWGNAGTAVECTFKQNGTDLTVQCGGGTEMNGQWRRGRLSWGGVKTGAHPMPQDRIVLTYTAELSERGRTMTGTWKLTSSVLNEKGTFEAHKIVPQK